MSDVSCLLWATMYSKPIYPHESCMPTPRPSTGWEAASPFGRLFISLFDLLHVALSIAVSHQSGKSMHIFRARCPFMPLTKGRKKRTTVAPNAENKSFVRSLARCRPESVVMVRQASPEWYLSGKLMLEWDFACLFFYVPVRYMSPFSLIYHMGNAARCAFSCVMCVYVLVLYAFADNKITFTDISCSTLLGIYSNFSKCLVE